MSLSVSHRTISSACRRKVDTPLLSFSGFCPRKSNLPISRKCYFLAQKREPPFDCRLYSMQSNAQMDESMKTVQGTEEDKEMEKAISLVNKIINEDQKLSENGNGNIIDTSWFGTKVGPMIAMSYNNALVLLEFPRRCKIESKIKGLKRKLNATFRVSKSPIIEKIESEVSLYFDGKLEKFETPIRCFGTDFQLKVWRALTKIPIGKSISYKELAISVNQPTAARAVAKANGANILVLVIPCHRVISANGGYGGYSSGISKKKSILDHEKKHFS